MPTTPLIARILDAVYVNVVTELHSTNSVSGSLQSLADLLAMMNRGELWLYNSFSCMNLT